MGDVKLLVGVGLMLGLTRGAGGVLSGLLLAGVVLVVLLAARRIGRRSLRTVRAVPDHRRAVGRAGPAARPDPGRWAGIRVTRTLPRLGRYNAPQPGRSGIVLTPDRRQPPAGRLVNVPRTTPVRTKRRSLPNDVHASLMRIRDQEKTVTWDSARKHKRPSRRLLFLASRSAVPARVARRRPQCAERPR